MKECKTPAEAADYFFTLSKKEKKEFTRLLLSGKLGLEWITEFQEIVAFRVMMSKPPEITNNLYKWKRNAKTKNPASHT